MKKLWLLLMTLLTLTLVCSAATAESISFPGGVQMYDTMDEVIQKNPYMKKVDSNTYKTWPSTIAGIADSYIVYDFTQINGVWRLTCATYVFPGNENLAVIDNDYIDIGNTLVGKYATRLPVYYGGWSWPHNRFTEDYHFIVEGPVAKAAHQTLYGLDYIRYLEIPYAYVDVFDNYMVKIEHYLVRKTNGMLGSGRKTWYEIHLCYYAYTQEEYNEAQNRQTRTGL